MSVFIESRSSTRDIMFVTAPPNDYPYREKADPLTDLKASYASYQHIGGLLPEARYTEFLAKRDTLTEEESLLKFRKNARTYAQFACLELTPQEEFLYGYFRGIMSNENGADFQESDISQPDVFNLTDQKLLAEILLMEGRLDRFLQFTTANPNIFK